MFAQERTKVGEGGPKLTHAQWTVLTLILVPAYKQQPITASRRRLYDGVAHFVRTQVKSQPCIYHLSFYAFGMFLLFAQAQCITILSVHSIFYTVYV